MTLATKIVRIPPGSLLVSYEIAPRPASKSFCIGAVACFFPNYTHPHFKWQSKEGQPPTAVFNSFVLGVREHNRPYAPHQAQPVVLMSSPHLVNSQRLQRGISQPEHKVFLENSLYADAEEIARMATKRDLDLQEKAMAAFVISQKQDGSPFLRAQSNLRILMETLKDVNSPLLLTHVQPPHFAAPQPSSAVILPFAPRKQATT